MWTVFPSPHSPRYRMSVKDEVSVVDPSIGFDSLFCLPSPPSSALPAYELDEFILLTGMTLFLATGELIGDLFSTCNDSESKFPNMLPFRAFFSIDFLTSVLSSTFGIHSLGILSFRFSVRKSGGMWDQASQFFWTHSLTSLSIALQLFLL